MLPGMAGYKTIDTLTYPVGRRRLSLEDVQTSSTWFAHNKLLNEVPQAAQRPVVDQPKNSAIADLCTWYIEELVAGGQGVAGVVIQGRAARTTLSGGMPVMQR